MTQLRSYGRTLLFAFAILAAICIFKVNTADAANSTYVTLTAGSYGKTYNYYGYDITGDKKNDTISILRSYNSYTYKETDTVKINGKTVFNKTVDGSSDAGYNEFYVKIYTLANGKPFYRIASRMFGYVPQFDAVYQYRSSGPKVIFNFLSNTLRYNNIIRACSVTVKNNSLICTAATHGSTVGARKLSFTLTYKNGTLVRKSKISYSVSTYNGQSKYLVAAKSIKVYRGTPGKSAVKFTVPAGAKVTCCKVYYSGSKFYWGIKYGSRIGWISGTLSFTIFKNALWAPA